MNPYYGLIENELKDLVFRGKPQSLYEPANYMMSLGGKRLRPVLVLMGCKLFDGDMAKALKPALAMELFHNFTLVHDDLMDKAALRRGQQTVHEKWDASTAVLSGDVMMVLSYEFLCSGQLPDLLLLIKLFNQTAIKVCEGQKLDMDFQDRENVSADEYVEMIGLKTAALLAGSLKTGALIAGAKGDEAALLYDFGYKLGISFQIQDDLLDTFGDAESFGKAIGGDIAENKKTILAIKAFDLAGPTEKELIKVLTSEVVPEKKIRQTIALYDRLGVREFAEGLRDKYYHEAIDSIEKIDSNNPVKKELIKLSSDLLNRVS
jgi:geranylgeranyl diphosphate synthase type II